MLKDIIIQVITTYGVPHCKEAGHKQVDHAPVMPTGDCQLHTMLP